MIDEYSKPWEWYGITEERYDEDCKEGQLWYYRRSGKARWVWYCRDKAWGMKHWFWCQRKKRGL